VRNLVYAVIAASCAFAVYYGSDLLRSPPMALSQDPVRQQQWIQDKIAWNRRHFAGAYEAVGKKDPRWDADARAALEAFSQRFAWAPDWRGAEMDAHHAARRALAAGCDDPCIFYLYVCTFYPAVMPPPVVVKRLAVKAAAAMEGSAYPAFMRANALLMGAYQLLKQPGASPAERAEGARLLDAALGLLPVSAAEDEPGHRREVNWFGLAKDMVEEYRRLLPSPEAALARVEATLARHPALEPIRLLVRGDFYVYYAWEGRGSGWARDVTPAGWRLFYQRLREARKALEAAWACGPDKSRAASLMLQVEIGDSRGRAAMEQWFDRALAGDGDHELACLRKMDWLNPKWHGSNAEMLAFGRACRATNNWNTGIPLMVAVAHLRLTEQLGDDEAKRSYLRRDDVWGEIASAYTEYLKHHPRDNFARSHFAYYACICSRHEEARRQFRQVGADLRWGFTITEEAMKQAREAVSGRGAVR
jgi:hypothetical protein